MDLALLLARDHDQLDRAIGVLIEPLSSLDRQSALDATRVSFAAHADAEAAVLYTGLAHAVGKHDLVELVAQVFAAHRIQESILRRMDVHARTDDWMCATIRLRRSLLVHAEQEQSTMLRALRDAVPPEDYHQLTGAYVNEKMRALGLLSTLDPISRRAATRATRRATR